MLSISMQDQLETEITELQEGIEVPRSPSSSVSRRASSIKSFVKSMVSPRLSRVPSSGWTNVQVCACLQTLTR